MRNLLVLVTAVILMTVSGCQNKEAEKETPPKVEKYGLIKAIRVDDLKDVIDFSSVTLDRDVSYDGKGSIRLTAEEPTTVNLYEIHGIDLEDARLLYQAKVKTKDVQGLAYIEMWVHFPDKGEYFTSSVHFGSRGTTNWKEMEAPFFLKKGQNPDYVRLNFVIKGKGTAWIDDIRLAAAPLPATFQQ